MWFNDSSRGSSNANTLDDLARTAMIPVDGRPNFEARENLYDQWIDTTTNGTNPNLPLLQNQKAISESIMIGASIKKPKALLLAILMLETPKRDWGVSRSDLVSAISAGITNDTGRVLEELGGILNKTLVRLLGVNQNSPNDHGSNHESYDNNISKIFEALDPIQLVKSISDFHKLSKKVDQFLDATWFTGAGDGNIYDNVIPLRAGENGILVFLQNWINCSSQIDGSIDLLQLPRRLEVTDKIIWLCRTGTPEGEKAAMLIADLLPRCGLIRDDGEVSKNGKWLLTALREYVSFLVEEEALELAPLPKFD